MNTSYRQECPETTTKMLQQTIKIHLRNLSILPWGPMIIKSHPLMGWKDIMVPSRAPIRDTRLLKTGMALAMM
jgi:hypothetical protein